MNCIIHLSKIICVICDALSLIIWFETTIAGRNRFHQKCNRSRPTWFSKSRGLVAHDFVAFTNLRRLPFTQQLLWVFCHLPHCDGLGPGLDKNFLASWDDNNARKFCAVGIPTECHHDKYVFHYLCIETILFDADDWKEASYPHNYVLCNPRLHRKRTEKESMGTSAPVEKTWVLLGLLALFLPLFSVEFFFSLSQQVICGSGSAGTFQTNHQNCHNFCVLLPPSTEAVSLLMQQGHSAGLKAVINATKQTNLESLNNSICGNVSTMRMPDCKTNIFSISNESQKTRQGNGDIFASLALIQQYCELEAMAEL
jgi:hypothetical protein